MQQTLSYNISSSWPRYIQDKPAFDPQLSAYMRDALSIFRVRLEQLADPAHLTTKDEALALTLMLTALVEGKLMLQSERDIF